MLEHVKSALKNSAIYSIGNVSTKLIGIILVPLYTQHLSLKEYGILSILEVSSQLLVTIFSANLYTAFFRWYWEKEYSDRQKSIFFTTFLSLIFISGLMVAGIYGFSNRLSVLLFDNSDFNYLIRLMSIAAALQILMDLVSALMRVQEKPVLYTSVNVAKLTISLILTVYFISSLHMGIDGIYKAQIISYVVYFILVSRYLIKNIRVHLEIRVLKEMIRFSLPLMISSVSGILLSIADRFCLKFLGELSYVGIYSLGFKIANTVKVFIISSVNLAISPVMYRVMDDPGNKRLYSKTMTYFAFGTMICVIGISVFGQEIIKFLAQNEAYWNAYKVIPIISFGLFFEMLKDTSLIGLNITKKTPVIARIIITSSIINIALNLLLIPYFSYIGSALASLVTQIIYFLLIYHSAQKYYPIPYEMEKIGKIMLCGMVLIVFGLILSPYALWIRLTGKLLLILSFPFILYLWNFYEPIEIQTIKGAWRKWRNPLNWKKNRSKIKLDRK